MNETFICKHCNKPTSRTEITSKGWKVCKECVKKFQKAYRDKNKDKTKGLNKKYREEKREQINAQRKQYRIANKESIRQRNKKAWAINGKKYSATHYKWKVEKLKTCVQFRLRETIRARISMAIRGSAKVGSAITLLGCSIEEFKTYIEKQFKPGMTWENWSLKGWHLDHIKPIKNFDLSNLEQLKEACHYTNMRPLWAEENLARRFEVLEVEDKKPLR